MDRKDRNREARQAGEDKGREEARWNQTVRLTRTASEVQSCGEVLGWVAADAYGCPANGRKSFIAEFAQGFAAGYGTPTPDPTTDPHAEFARRCDALDAEIEADIAARASTGGGDGVMERTERTVVVGAHERVVGEVELRGTCRACGAGVVYRGYPGAPSPRECGPCKRARRNGEARERMQRRRGTWKGSKGADE